MKSSSMTIAIARALGLGWPTGNTKEDREERAHIEAEIERELDRHLESVPAEIRETELEDAHVAKTGRVKRGKSRMWNDPKPVTSPAEERINKTWRKLAARRAMHDDWHSRSYPGSKDVVFRSPQGIEVSTCLSCAVGLQDALGGTVVGFEELFPPVSVLEPFNDDIPF